MLWIIFGILGISLALAQSQLLSIEVSQIIIFILAVPTLFLLFLNKLSSLRIKKNCKWSLNNFKRYLLYIFLSAFTFSISNIYFQNQILSQLTNRSANAYALVQLEVLDISHKSSFSTIKDDNKSLSFNGKVLGIKAVGHKKIEPKDFWNEDLNKLEKLRLAWYPPTPEIKEGDVWQLKVRLKPPRGYFNGVGFDYEKWLFQKEIGARGYIVKSDFNKKLYESSFSFSKIRENVLERLLSSLSSPPIDNQSIDDNNIDYYNKSLALIIALITGENRFFDQSDWSLFSRTGITHLVIISGFHFTLIFGIVYFLFKFLISRIIYYKKKFELFVLKDYKDLNFAKNKIYSWILKILNYAEFLSFIKSDKFIVFISLNLLIIYAFFVGFSLPTQRALFMIIILIIWFILRRNQPFLFHFLLALAVVVLIDIHSLFSSSLWLSFGATFVIWLHIHTRKKLVNHTNKLNNIKILNNENLRTNHSHNIYNQFQKIYQYSAKAIIELFIIQLKVSVIVIPIVAYFFGKVSLFSPFINLLAIPLLGIVITPIALLSFLLFLIFEPIGVVLLKSIIYITEFLYQSLYWIDTFSVVWSVDISLSVTFITILIGLVLSFNLFPYRLFLLFLYIPVLYSYYSFSNNIKEGEFILSVIDVGQANATLVQTQNNNYLIDTAATNNFNNILESMAVDKIDAIFISSYDSDHSGGLYNILASIEVDELFINKEKRYVDFEDKLNDLEKKQTVKINTCTRGKSIISNGVILEIVHPSNNFLKQKNKHNNYSCVIRVQGYGGSALIPADIERQAEEYILNNVDNHKIKSDILIIPHHGSKSSSSIDFINSVSPSIGIVSSAYLNRYGHPHREIIERYESNNIKIYRTDYVGGISVFFRKDKIDIKSSREENSRFWNHNIEMM